jgi:hypothetical protein
MNEATERELKIVVEQAVRPVRATISRKRRMREELLAHLMSIFEEERLKTGDEQAALDQAKRRFGDPKELTAELQESMSRWEGVGFALAKYSFQPGESVFRLARMCVLYMGMMVAAMLVIGLVIAVVRDRLSELGLFANVGFIIGVLMAAYMFVFLFLSERMGLKVCGKEGERSLVKALLYGIVSLGVFPALAFSAYLAGSFDLTASLGHLRFACCFAPATPLIFLLMGRQMLEEMRYNHEWASLEISE